MRRFLVRLVLLGLWVSLLAVGQDAPPTGPELSPPLSNPVSGLDPGNDNLQKLKKNLPANPRVMVIPVNDQESTRYGMIDPWQVGFVSRRLAEAESGGYDLVILEVNTNGGMVASCEQINRAIADCPVPVIAHVRGTAFSGGALISLNCNAIVMQPGSNIGGAQAVGLMHDLEKDQREKARSMLVAMVQSYAEKFGYPSAIAQGMVDMGITVYETDDPKHRFMTDTELADWKENETVRGPAPNIVATWKEPDTILTLTSQQAYDCGLASAVPQNRAALFATMGITPAVVYENHITGAERIARFLGHPGFMIFLLVVAVVALIYEWKAGGHYVGYFVILLCAVLFAWLAFLGDSAGWLELILVLAGLVLLGVELFVLPGFGVAGIAGIGLILLSILCSFIPSGALPSLFESSSTANPFQTQVLVQGLTYAAAAMCTVLGLLVLALWLGVKLPGVSFLALKSDVGAPSATLETPAERGVALPASTVIPAPVESTSDDENPLAKLVGQEGLAETVLRPSGKVRIAGISYDAQSEGGWIDPGARIRVLEARTAEVIVREVKAG